MGSSRPFTTLVRGILPPLLLLLAGCGDREFKNPHENDPVGIIRGKLVTTASVAAAHSALVLEQDGRELFEETTGGADGGDDGGGTEVPVQGAVCTLEGGNRSTSSNADGVFELTDVPAGSYILICRKDGGAGATRAFLQVVEVRVGEVTDLGTVELTPTGTIRGHATLAGATDSSGILVALSGASIQGTTDAAGQYVLSSVPAGTYQVRLSRDGYEARQLDRVVVASGETTQAEDVELPLSTGPTATIRINDGAKYTASHDVTLTITATGGKPILMMLSEHVGFVGASWEPFATSKAWHFDGDGARTVSAKFSDGNIESATVTADIVVDTDRPVAAIAINGGVLVTKSQSVLLDLTGSQDTYSAVDSMRVSNDADFSNAPWQPYQGTLSWQLAGAGDGTKTVYVMVRDKAGNESTPSSASIVLDTGVPVEPAITIQEGDFVSQCTVHVSAFARGATKVYLAKNASLTGASPRQLVDGAAVVVYDVCTGALSAAGEMTVYGVFEDDAGNRTAAVSDSIIVDSSPPSTPSLVESSPMYVNSAAVDLHIATPSTDDHFATYQILGGQYQTWTDTSESATFHLEFGADGNHPVTIRGKDKAGNLGLSSFIIYVTVDRQAPQLPTDVRVAANINDALVSWSSPEQHSATVSYGLKGGALDRSVEDSAFSGSHQLTITGLQPLTDYQLRVVLKDRAGNVATTQVVELRTGTRFTQAVISTDTVVTAAGSPVLFTSDVSVGPSATLTLEPGAILEGRGGRLLVYGTLKAAGTATARVMLKDLAVVGGDGATPFTMNLSFIDMQGGELIQSFGGGMEGSLTLSDSVLRDVPRIELWYPSTDCYLERNVFLRCDGIAVWIQSSGRYSIPRVFVRNNVFKLGTGPAVISQAANEYASADAVSLTAERNSFLDTDRVAVALGTSSSARMTATNNYWGTTERTTIEGMITDANDNGGLAVIPFEPYLTAPDPATPDPTPYF